MFVTAKAQDFITYSRSSIGTYIGSDGLLKTAAVDEPRIEYGSDGSLKGLLIEEQRTNLITYSEDFSESAWSKTFSEFTMDAVGPDGASNSAGTLTDDISGGAGTAYTQVSVTVSTETTYTFSIFAKADQLSDIQLRCVNFTTPGTVGVYFDLSAGEVGNATGSGVTAEIEDFGSGWYRCSITFTTDVTDTSGIIRIHLANGESASISRDGTSSVLFYGAQLEEGSFATSYIPTSGSQQTRSADVASIPVSAFGYNDQAGTVVVEAQTNNPASSLPHMWQFDAGVSNTRIACTFRSSSGAVRMFIQNGGSTDASLYRGTPLTDTTEVTTAGSWQTDDIAFSYDGSAVAADTDGCAIPSVSTLRIGSSNVTATTALNGHIRSLKYYPRKVSDTELQTLTT